MGGMGMEATGDGMAMPAALSAAEAGLRAELVAPPSIQPGRPAPLVYRLTDAATGAPFTDVVVSHEQPVHLIAVRRDLTNFQHLHPQPTGAPGEYALEATFAEPGSYLLNAEFARADGKTVLLSDQMVVGAPSGAAVALTEDAAPKTVSDDARVALLNADSIRAGQETALTFRVEDPRTGAPVTDLQPYLGAPAHVVVMSADGQRFAHTHGEAVGGAADRETADDGHGDDGQGGADAAYGPEIAFHHNFSQPGLYRVWGQFRDRHGTVLTADFVVRAQ
jgi:Cu+-exporting ATPase